DFYCQSADDTYNPVF
nr:immunoglobulin light chain junction region [Macaca mulatta]MOW17835.1 immunoglobulin light chain junction region [Macaca mulatta]